MTLRRLFSTLAAAVVLLASGSAFAQETVLSGLVTTREDGLPLPGATVGVAALGVQATTDAEGRYSLSLPASAVGTSVEVRVTASGLTARTATVQITPGPLSQDFALGLGFSEEITVGSRAAGAAAEKAVPVDILTQRQILTTGASETNAILSALAPSFNFPRPTLSDGADSVRPATLRGLGPDQVLVLLNGKRRHQSAHIPTSGVVGRGSTGVDLNAIPASAIEKVEVLRDGAAAQYGSDAIAGVINVVLKSGPSPLTVNAKLGTTIGTWTNTQLQEVDHNDGELLDTSASYGFRVGRGAITAVAEYRDRNPTNRASPDVRDQIRTGDANSNPVAQPNHHWGDSEETNVMTFLNGTLPVNQSETVWAYAFGGWSRREGSHGGFYRRALDARNWPSIYPLGFLPTIEPTVIDSSATAGLRGVKGLWNWDLSAQQGHNRFDFDLTQTQNTSLGPNVPPNQTDFYAGSLVSNQFVANLDLSRPVEAGLHKPLNVAFGVEFRRENYKILAGEPASYVDGLVRDQFGGRSPAGAQVFPGFRPSNAVDANRHNVGAYVDLEGDASDKIRLGLAGRVENYSDFGSTGDGKLTARFAPTKRFVIRAATSTGFRAPSLAQANFSTVSTNFINIAGVVTPVEVGTFAVDSPVARALGSTDLKAEQSTHLSGGLVLNPVDALDITVDVYRVNIDDRIVFSGNFTGGAITTLLQPFGASGARYFTNAVDTRTDGFDLTAAYRFDLQAAGNLRVSAAYNHNETEIRGSITTPEVLRTLLANADAVLFDREQTLRSTCGQPKDSLRLTEDWRWNKLSVVARQSRYGEYCFATNVVANDQTFSPEWVADLDVTWQADHLTLGAGVQNIFDVFPDRTSLANQSFAVTTFPGQSPFGMNGRFVYARVGYRF
jgi:iron complex outermembrane recepter protein